MPEDSWYIYQNDTQQGPFTREKVLEFANNNMIAQNAFLFHAQWDSWRSYSECLDELKIPPQTEKRSSGQRISIQGKIIVHDDRQLVIAEGVNLSVSGICIETDNQLFEIGADLKLTCKIDNLDRPFNAITRVIHYNDNEKYKKGFGLKFEQIEKKYTNLIASHIKNSKK